jgi:hypothetical protein
MRSLYRILAGLVALGVVLQAAFIAVGWFAVMHDTDSGAVYDKNSGDNWGQAAHSAVGMMVLPLIALVLLVVSFFAGVPDGVKWAAITFGVTVLQIVLAFASYGAPIVGALHGINAFALAAVASVAMRKARQAGAAAPVAA